MFIQNKYAWYFKTGRVFIYLHKYIINLKFSDFANEEEYSVVTFDMFESHDRPNEQPMKISQFLNTFAR